MSEEIANVDAGGLNLFGAGRMMATSLDMSDPSNRVKMLKAMQDCDARLVEQVNMPIEVTDYVAHEIDLTSKENGEIVRCTRLVLLDVQGCTYECVSATLLQSIKTVAFAFGPPPWVPPLKMTVKTRKKGERSIYWFAVDANIVR